ncbi:MAG: hypothetical protein QHH07_04805 [Sedimentisphaerales bacterium]|nr:hypothetical protein [Sedimentisphaerales bacterium]
MRTRTVVLVLDEKISLMPGMFARVQLILRAIDDAVIIPKQAVLTNPTGGNTVYLVIDGKATSRSVKLGIEQADKVQVVEGLEPGQTIIVGGHEKIVPGMEVRVVEPASNPRAASAPQSGPSRGGKLP